MDGLEAALLVAVGFEHLVVEVGDGYSAGDVFLHESGQSLQSLLLARVLPSQGLLHVGRLYPREHRALLVVLLGVVVVVEEVFVLRHAGFVHGFAGNVLFEGGDAGGDASLAHFEVGVVVGGVFSMDDY